jgi:hypothetical protein
MFRSAQAAPFNHQKVATGGMSTLVATIAITSRGSRGPGEMRRQLISAVLANHAENASDASDRRRAMPATSARSAAPVVAK